jgi:hypothetical protein
MAYPYSDTGTSQPHTMVHDEATRLAERLGLAGVLAASFGRWERLLFPAMNKLLDRIEALERDRPPPTFNGG